MRARHEVTSNDTQQSRDNTNHQNPKDTANLSRCSCEIYLWQCKRDENQEDAVGTTTGGRMLKEVVKQA
ncbi:hypothetical protein Pint_17223 [Pistacia integerrima]|uniref:Uncharacterized protein n=1 Tax=Pistacia integerrima TaxID=434235 RepID=A0ACC0YVY9_9ROSI|nr:hypothetical protein Pint_17223 [Pistacia integerrima]